eukprot:scaffold234213_cov23-Tisochrysis_lutea.AAC.1
MLDRSDNRLNITVRLDTAPIHFPAVVRPEAAPQITCLKKKKWQTQVKNTGGLLVLVSKEHLRTTHLRGGDLHSLVPVAFHNGLLVDAGASNIAALTNVQEGGAHVLQGKNKGNKGKHLNRHLFNTAHESTMSESKHVNSHYKANSLEKGLYTSFGIVKLRVSTIAMVLTGYEFTNRSPSLKCRHCHTSRLGL